MVAYRCPEDGQKLLIYAAKAHPELSTAPDELVITYCCNTGSLAEHMTRPDIYVPRDSGEISGGLTLVFDRFAGSCEIINQLAAENSAVERCIHGDLGPVRAHIDHRNGDVRTDLDFLTFLAAEH